MLYAIIAKDVENSLEKRLSVRKNHLERLEQLKTEGRLIIAGPHPLVDSEIPTEAGFSGSLIIAQFADLETAQSWANDDPYVKAGVYAEVSVLPFIKVLP